MTTATRTHNMLAYHEYRQVEELLKKVWGKFGYRGTASDETVATEARKRLGRSVVATNVAFVRRALDMTIRPLRLTRQEVDRLEAKLLLGEPVICVKNNGSKLMIYDVAKYQHLSATLKVNRSKRGVARAAANGVPVGA